MQHEDTKGTKEDAKRKRDATTETQRAQRKDREEDEQERRQ
jgi:hypothetical protein